MQSLVDHLKQGNLEAFNAIYAEYHQRLYFFIKKKTHSVFLAEEVVQLTFIKLWNCKTILRSHIDISVQLFHMAKQVLIDQLRKEQVRSKYEGDSAETPFTDNLIRMIEAKDLMRIFDEELSDMPAMRKLIFTLSREKGMSHKEISEMMGVSIKTVEAHITKVLSRLRQYMYSVLF
ncbi:sigma-70 family RNA polymerase sigma factor [Olivibacter sp. SDN3]|uniref:sigma-70 family RNA polymerase sigma factor n=1 Tax=Olivibacter sp. SDN3 TaxID=2764720 RepID=UPI0016514306|nr:sigma-70 family RNA polymerase sigma factor [Olivibacter sp. SDN3]QNL50184.1 sigma-70 family RNA polymerase sigma factor [Olivibacter sp. SDN3]